MASGEPSLASIKFCQSCNSATVPTRKGTCEISLVTPPKATTVCAGTSIMPSLKYERKETGRRRQSQPVPEAQRQDPPQPQPQDPRVAPPPVAETPNEMRLREQIARLEIIKSMNSLLKLIRYGRSTHSRGKPCSVNTMSYINNMPRYSINMS